MSFDLPAMGIDMMSPQTKLVASTVRKADNVDVAAGGITSRRKGYRVINPEPAHSMHHCDKGTLAVFGSELYGLEPSGDHVFLLDLGGDSPVEFFEYNGITYLTSLDGMWMIPPNEPPRPVGVPLPSALPDIAAAATGTLAPGKYGVALAVVAPSGEESGSVFLGQVDLPDGGGIILDGLVVNSAFKYRLYITQPDGEVLSLAEEVAADASLKVITTPASGAVETNTSLRPLPSGSFICGYNGRLFTAKGDTLYYSEALNPHLYDSRSGFIRAIGRIRFICPTDDGIYMADDRGVMFLEGGDAPRFKQRIADTNKAVRRSALIVPRAYFNPEMRIFGDEVVIWLSEIGYILGAQQGITIPLQQDRVRVDPDREGRSRFLVRDGIKQIITLVASTDIFGYGLANDQTGETQ